MLLPSSETVTERASERRELAHGHAQLVVRLQQFAQKDPPIVEMDANLNLRADGAVGGRRSCNRITKQLRVIADARGQVGAGNPGANCRAQPRRQAFTIPITPTRVRQQRDRATSHVTGRDCDRRGIQLGMVDTQNQIAGRILRSHQPAGSHDGPPTPPRRAMKRRPLLREDDGQSVGFEPQPPLHRAQQLRMACSD